MAQLYDLMLLVDPNVPADRQSAVLSEVDQMISSGGELVGTHDWGTRRLAYEIDHRPDATYRLYQFNAEPDLLERLQQRLRIMDGVLRFRIIRLKPGSPPPPPPRDHAPPRPREEREREPEGRVAARAAADAPPPDAGQGPDAEQGDAPPADAPPADVPPAESPAP
jgi:small subunit ribosomal protein S6